jgi:hypothetical protein
VEEAHGCPWVMAFQFACCRGQSVDSKEKSVSQSVLSGKAQPAVRRPFGLTQKSQQQPVTFPLGSRPPAKPGRAAPSL